MKKSLQLLCLVIALALIPASLLIAGDLPPDSGKFVQKKYSGWNGVLRGWISCRWEPGGSFNSWLNACAAEFEKNHPGVYLEFSQVEESAMQQIHTSGIRPPDIIFFSPGILENAEGLLPVDLPDALLADLHTNGADRCAPVAMGGYIWAYNRQLTDDHARDGKQLALLPPDDPGRNYSAAVLALCTGSSMQNTTELPEPDLDLGLPANADANLQRGDAMDAFIDGDLPCLPVTQREIARLSRLQEKGTGPDWALAITGDYALADQILYGAAVDQNDAGAAAREDLSREFIAFLLAESSQQKLKQAGAFPVTRLQIYDSFSAYAQLGALLQNRRLLTVDPFSEYSFPNSEAIVREFRNGSISAVDGLSRMGLLPQG